MPFVKVTGYLEVEDHEIDDGPLGPLTTEADEKMRGFTGDAPGLNVLEDMDFEPDDR